MQHSASASAALGAWQQCQGDCYDAAGEDMVDQACLDACGPEPKPDIYPAEQGYGTCEDCAVSVAGPEIQWNQNAFGPQVCYGLGAGIWNPQDGQIGWYTSADYSTCVPVGEYNDPGCDGSGAVPSAAGFLQSVAMLTSCTDSPCFESGGLPGPMDSLTITTTIDPATGVVESAPQNNWGGIGCGRVVITQSRQVTPEDGVGYRFYLTQPPSTCYFKVWWDERHPDGYVESKEWVLTPANFEGKCVPEGYKSPDNEPWTADKPDRYKWPCSPWYPMPFAVVENMRYSFLPDYEPTDSQPSGFPAPADN